MAHFFKKNAFSQSFWYPMINNNNNEVSHHLLQASSFNALFNPTPFFHRKPLINLGKHWTWLAKGLVKWFFVEGYGKSRMNRRVQILVDHSLHFLVKLCCLKKTRIKIQKAQSM